jgi:thermostable 8-oxoguanine DNA glycosylase
MHQQEIFALAGDQTRALRLPPPNAEVLPGVYWGRFDEFFTPAFWATRAWLDEPEGCFRHFRLGATLPEEVAACLLGGHGIPAEVGVAAFERLRAHGALRPPVCARKIQHLLSMPMLVRERPVRYRFARQRAQFISASLNHLAMADQVPEADQELRAYLLCLPGIGPKTASWITRNWLESDNVAIIDIHIFRACVAAGVFSASLSPASAYYVLEDRFLQFAAALGVRASVLDNLMWQTMRRLGHLLTRPGIG